MCGRAIDAAGTTSFAEIGKAQRGVVWHVKVRKTTPLGASSHHANINITVSGANYIISDLVPEFAYLALVIASTFLDDISSSVAFREFLR